jgi:hypothetical protein
VNVIFYVSLERAPEQSQAVCECLPQALEELDGLARAAGRDPLSTFLTVSPEQLSRFGAGASDQELPPSVWFDPADGLQTVDWLVSRLSASPDEDDQRLVPELKAIQSSLSAAIANRHRFRFLMDLA